MKAIIAVNCLGYIGRDNKLIWKSKQDLLHFKELTLNQRLLVGYNTSTLLPKLKNREIIVDDMNKIIENIDWCIGGKRTYEKYCHLFTELHISRIDNYEIGDTLFPDLKNLNPNCKIFTYNFKCD
ncbi:MAG: dihydrofolate reductase [Candidatus Muirbacterium halophilum]|nr:dihydrofolate reductase [Candidatus Muirbacterium halophilum]